jgi:hypothetical protein
MGIQVLRQLILLVLQLEGDFGGLVHDFLQRKLTAETLLSRDRSSPYNGRSAWRAYSSLHPPTPYRGCHNNRSDFLKLVEGRGEVSDLYSLPYLLLGLLRP